MNYPQGQQFPPNQPPQRPRWTQDRNTLVIAGIAAIALLVVLLIVVVVAIGRTGNDTSTTAATVTVGAATTTAKAKGKVTSTPTPQVADDEFAPTAPGTYDPQGPKQFRPKGVKSSDPATGGMIFSLTSPDGRVKCSASKRELLCQYESRTDAEARTLDSPDVQPCRDASTKVSVYNAMAFTLAGAPGQQYGQTNAKRNPSGCKTSGPVNWPKDLQVMPGDTFAWLPSPNGDAYCTMTAEGFPEDSGAVRGTYGVECSTTKPDISRFHIGNARMD